jgi:sugar diacid utilization regulator
VGQRQRPGAARGDDRAAICSIATRLEEARDAMASRMIERYRSEIVDYQLAGESFLRDEVYGVTHGLLGSLIEAIRSGEPPPDAAFDRVRSAAARRVHQGIPMESFLHAVRILGQEVWDRVLALADVEAPAEREAALEVAGHVMRFVDDLSTYVAASYSAEAQGASSDRAVLRRDLLDALIAGHGDSERIRRLARTLRVRLGESYVVVLMRGADVGGDEHTELPLTTRIALRRLVEEARSRLRPPAGTLLVGMRQGEVVALYPASQATELEQIKQECDALAGELDDDVAIGFSSWHAGMAAIAVAYAEARDAVEIALGAGIRGRAVAFNDVLIDHMVRSSPHGDRILDQTIRPLVAYDRDRQGDLVKTLRVYLDSGFNLTRSAEALSVHPNTVVYRLKRVKDLSGRDPYDPDDLLLLLLGLKLTELSCPS